MNALIGHQALILAFVASSLQLCSPLLIKTRFASLALPSAQTLMSLQTLFVSIAFATLVYAFASSDFSVQTVLQHSHSAKPLLYKITGTWGNHEGSMLLWALILAGYGWIFSLRSRCPDRSKLATLAFHGLIAGGILLYLLAASNPFIYLAFEPKEGLGLNPLLQDIGLAIHPPLLYLGYVGFGLVFAYACGALWVGEFNRDWARYAHSWSLVPWSFLTAGIGLGSWWAYRELGWGGWWFWDPVENVSLLPWFTGVALLHSIITLSKRGRFASWVALLALMTFVMSLLGTFIVRSGLLTSVHAFATDPSRGIFILGYIGIITLVGLAVYSWRGIAFKHSAPTSTLLSRESALLFNNLIMVVTTLCVLLATLYPMLLELFAGRQISVGAPYFNTTILPLLAPAVLVAGIAPFVPWGSITRGLLFKRTRNLLGISIILTVGIGAFYYQHEEVLLTTAGTALGLWLLIASAAITFKALRAAPKHYRLLGMAIAHAGVAILTLGVTAQGLHSHTYERIVSVGVPFDAGAYSFTLTDAIASEKDNYKLRRGTFVVEKNGEHTATLQPEIRFYPTRGMQTSESAIHSTFWRDLYIVLGQASEQNSTLLRIYINPGMSLIWGGFLAITLGGFIAAWYGSLLRK